MKKTLAAAAIILALSSASAFAQERAGGAAVGAVSGALVLGPVGALAGAVIGYTAGPSISRSWRERHPQRRAANNNQHRPVRDANAAVPNGRVAQNAPAANPPPTQAVAPPPPAKNVLPPVQGLE